MDWLKGKVYRTPPYLMVKTMVSCRFSPYFMVKKPWFPVKIFPKKPIQHSIDFPVFVVGCPEFETAD